MGIENKMLPDNPAARLQYFFAKMLEVENIEKEKISLVFSRLLDVDDIPSIVFPHYAQLFVLIDEAYNKVIQYYPKQQKTHLTWFKLGG